MAQPLRVEGVRYWSFGNVTRVAVQTNGTAYKVRFERIEKPNRILFDLTGLAAPKAAEKKIQIIPVNDRCIRQIRVARVGAKQTRIVLDLETSSQVSTSQLVNPDRLMIEVHAKARQASVLTAKTINRPQPANDDPDDAYHPHRDSSGRPMLTRTSGSAISTTRITSMNPITVETVTRAKPAATHTESNIASMHSHLAPVPVVEAKLDIPSTPLRSSELDAPTFSPPMKRSDEKTNVPAGDRSLVRVFGLKMGRVVIDAGHGGHDSGTIGPNGLMEKDLVLDVALRLGALISKQMGAEVIYTRSTDVFIPLEERTKIANAQKADLFISVHANSSPEPEATGVETYYFNLTSDKSGLDLATRENATADSSISDLNDLLHRAVLQAKREESREFAQRVQTSLSSGAQKSSYHARDRGVRQAPFMVLIGATMPSILAEIGFVSNPRDEKLLRREDEREKIAEALYRGVAQYASSLNHMEMARASGE